MSDQIKTETAVSVIIPTYNRKRSLLRTLESLRQQTYPTERFEVILVDDGGNDGTTRITELTFPFKLRYVRQENQGAAVARNEGARQAQGDILVFLDDDITVVPQFIASFYDDLAHCEQTVAVGVLHPPDRQDRNAFRDIYAQLRSATSGPEITFVDCLSGILAVRREHFWQIGGMEDVAGDGRTAWGDVDFGYRAYRQGFSFRRTMGAVGYHNDRAVENLAMYCRVQKNASEQVVQLFHKYPGIESHLSTYHDKGPIFWRQDALGLILRKLARQAVSSKPVMWAMEGVVPALEIRAPTSTALRLLYRWISSGYIYRGYREGLRKYGMVSESLGSGVE